MRLGVLKSGSRHEDGLLEEKMPVINVNPIRNRKKGNVRLSWALLGLVSCVLLIGERAVAYQEEAVVKGGSITGVVKFSGVIPPPTTYKVNMGSNPEFCRTIANEQGIIDISQARVSSKQKLADVVVFLQELERGKAVPKEGAVVTVDRCQFGPRVVGIMDGQSLRVAMRDSIVHQIRGWEMLDAGRLPLFQLANLQEGGQETVPLRARRSSIIKLECDQHRFMQGWILLTANPYVSVTNDHGVFQLMDIPAGTHTVGAWHPVLGYQEAKVTVTSGQQEILDLTFKSPSQP